jgi:hypothetical protein
MFCGADRKQMRHREEWTHSSGGCHGGRALPLLLILSAVCGLVPVACRRPGESRQPPHSTTSEGMSVSTAHGTPAATGLPVPTGPTIRPKKPLLPGPLGHERWPDETVKQLEEDAASGDGQAAYALHVYYGVNLHDEERATRWLHRAMALRNPSAEELTAEAIRSHGLSFAPYGKSEPEARERLLDHACKTNAGACRQLGDSFDSGFCGGPKPNYGKARLYYLRGAELGDTLSWERLATYLHKGYGGPVDDPAAYFWTALKAGCVAPSSIGGKKVWSFRELLAESLSLGELESQWTAVDKFMAEYHAGLREMRFAPFLKTMVSDDIAAQSEREADAREVEHRSRLRSAKLAQQPKAP